MIAGNYLAPVRFLVLACAIVLGGQSFALAKEIRTGAYGTWGTAKDKMFQAAKDNNFKIVVSTDTVKATAMGMQCLYPFWLSYDIAQNEDQWKAFIDNVKAVVTANKNNNSVFGWYLTDEPDWHQIPLSRLKELSRTIKSIDKTKPTFAVLTLPDKWYRYLPYFDIIGIDPYLDTTTAYAGRETDKVEVWIKKAKSDLTKLKLNKPLYVVLGAFDLRPKGTVKSICRKPTPAEFNKMVSTCLQQKVDGLLVFSLSIMEDSNYYPWDLTVDDPTLWDTVRSLPDRVSPGAN